MKKFDVTVALILLVFSLTSVVSEDKPRCFQYTLIPSMLDTEATNLNCSAVKGAPCYYPVLTEPPSVEEILQNKYTCQLKPGNVCVKYTFFYNGEVENSTTFCGKVIENQKSAVTTGCYRQYVDGYQIETCACIPMQNQISCNSSIRAAYSILALIIGAAITMANWIKDNM